MILRPDQDGVSRRSPVFTVITAHRPKQSLPSKVNDFGHDLPRCIIYSTLIRVHHKDEVARNRLQHGTLLFRTSYTRTTGSLVAFLVTAERGTGRFSFFSSTRPDGRLLRSFCSRLSDAEAEIDRPPDPSPAGARRCVHALVRLRARVCKHWSSHRAPIFLRRGALDAAAYTLPCPPPTCCAIRCTVPSVSRCFVSTQKRREAPKGHVITDLFRDDVPCVQSHLL